jgi:hypothetical protein
MNVDKLFFMLRWDWCCFDKMCVGTRYTEVVFLHPVGSAGRVVHSNASRVRYVDTLFFLLWWDRYGLHKKHAGTRYVELMFLHPMGSVGHVVHSCVSAP